MITATSGGALNAIPFWHCNFFDGNALSIGLSRHGNYRALLLSFYEKISFSELDISRARNFIVPFKK